MTHTGIVGGGIIGFSLAYELLQRQHRVTLLDRPVPGRSASLAGAGMLPPANSETAIHPLEHLTAFSNLQHRQWSGQLMQQTGIDDGYRQAGSIHVARTAGEVASLVGAVDEWTTQAIECHWWRGPQLQQALAERFPCLALHAESTAPIRSAVWLPAAAQFDNARRLTALRKAGAQAGLRLIEMKDSPTLRIAGDQPGVAVDGEAFEFDRLVVAAGPWTEAILRPLGLPLSMQPVRGQIVRYQLSPEQYPEMFQGALINEGTRYLVPRPDGSLLAGSTIEEVGFENQTTEEELSAIRLWAASLVPALNATSEVEAWSGLRPATYDGFPYLGCLPGYPSVLVAAGHFKSGLQLSTGTAVVLADLIERRPARIDLSPFDPGRVLR